MIEQVKFMVEEKEKTGIFHSRKKNVLGIEHVYVITYYEDDYYIAECHWYNTEYNRRNKLIEEGYVGETTSLMKIDTYNIMILRGTLDD